MDRIRILYVITSLGLGGAEKLLLSYLKYLDSDKYEFFVCALRENPDDLLNEISAFAKVIKLKKRNKFNPLIIFELRRTIKKLNPHIIHTHLFQPRVYTTIANIFNSIPLITQKHSIVNPKKHHVFILLEMICILFNKKVIAISESVKNSLNKYEFIRSNKILVLPNSIEYQKFNEVALSKKKSNNGEIIIGIVGRLEKVKGINYLLFGMKKILAKFPYAKLEIIGDGSNAQELKNLSEKLKISNSVIFFGKFTDVIPFYSRMDVFVLPSILEGFGIVLLEAMAAGIPVVATNVNGIKEVIVNMKSGLLVPPKNPEAIADAVIKIVENPQLAKELAEEGLKRARLFDIKDHLIKLDHLYTNLLGEES